MNDIKKTVLSKFLIQTPTLETNEINTNSLTLAGQSLEEFIEQNMGGAEAIEQLQSKVGTLETSVGEINGEIEELSSKSYAYTDSENTFTENNTFANELTLSAGAKSDGNITVNEGNVIVNQSGTITFFDDGETILSSNASGSLYVDCSSSTPFVLDHNCVYDFGVISQDINLGESEFFGKGKLIQTCEVWFETGSTVPTVTWPVGTYWIESATGSAPTLSASTRYRIALRSEVDTIVASIAYTYKKA